MPILLTKYVSAIQKMILINCFALLSVSLIIAHNSPSSAYEYSIYTFTPRILWVSVILSILCGFFIVLFQIFNNDIKTHFEIFGLCLISLCFIICNSIFIIRGYYLWCMHGDPATHIGYINEILFTGHIPINLFYPIIHIYTSQIFFVSNINVYILSKILPFIFSCLYIPFMYILSKSMFSKKGQIILSTIAGCTLINGWYLNFTPNCLSNLYFPFLMYIFLKVTFTQDSKWEFLVVIMCIFYPIFHIIPTFIFVIFIGIMSAQNLIFYKWWSLKVPNNKKTLKKFKLTLVILILVWSVTWISSYYVWDLTIRNIYIYMTEGGVSTISGVVKNIDYAKDYGYNVIEIILKNISGPLVYLLISVISFIIFLKNRDELKLHNKLFLLCGPLWSICLVIVIFYFLHLLFDPFRLVTYTTMISTLFVGYFLEYLINNLKSKNRKIFSFLFLGTIFLFLIIWINGIFTLYPSPYNFAPSYHITKSEVEGMDFLLENKNLNTEITGITVAPLRFEDLLLSPEKEISQNVSYDIPSYLKIPYHFGYDQKSSLSNYLYTDAYLVINEVDKSLYVDLFPKMAEIRWTPKDYERLNFDTSIEKVYSSKKVDIFVFKFKGDN